MKRKVYLDGELGEKYGKELSINVESFVDVFKLLEANYPDVKEYLINCHEKGIGFICEVAEKPLSTEEELLLRYPEGDMYICPHPMGADSGGLKIFAAIALVALAVALPQLLTFQGQLLGQAVAVQGSLGAALAGSLGGFVQFAAFAALGLAVNLAITGIMQIMAPDPATEDNTQDESYLFQGSGQTILEGDPVPVLYGKLRVPGRPVSFAVENASGQFTNIAQLSVGSSTPVDQADYDAGTNPPEMAGDGVDPPPDLTPGGGFGNIHDYDFNLVFS